MAAAYYNEHDPYAAQWLRNLIAAGHIAPGVVDERDIRDVEPADLRGFTQCHFFAGIGVWSYALRGAGWPDDRPVWTGSCPCQPFSSAGRATGFADERHLWPHWFHLLEICRPPVLFGEQVASKDGLAWLDLVQADLEGAGYASAALDLCAAGIGAPHIRQRLYWVADSDAEGQCQRQKRDGNQAQPGQQAPRGYDADRRSGSGGLADSGVRSVRDSRRGAFEGTSSQVPREIRQQRVRSDSWSSSSTGTEGQPAPGPTNGFWSSPDWLFCRDGKWRPVEPGTFPLAHGAPSRVGRLRAYGNAIVAPLAEEFIRAYLSTHE